MSFSKSYSYLMRGQHRSFSLACKSLAPPNDRSSSSDPNFGFLFDIDGVIVRGKRVLPFAPKAFESLVDSSGNFRIPTVFVTNAGNRMRQEKADQLSKWLNVKVDEDQVVMSHSPLKMFTDYHDKHVLVVGQGPIRNIATNLGFKKVTTMKRLRHMFPTLDAVDHKRRNPAPCAFEPYYPKIEAIVLFGEPTRWETSLQLVMDVLISNGQPSAAPSVFPYPHLPILACNMDLQWMAEAPMPRFGHGAFLLSLENLYKKITGHDMIYTALAGKPSEITYRHGEHVLQTHAQRIGLKDPIKNIYCIGDNICTDIFGANLYNRYLQSQRIPAETEEKQASIVGQQALGLSRCVDHLIQADGELRGAENCFSILVETGVFSADAKDNVSLRHSPRDFLPVEESYQDPTYTVRNVLDAVNLAFDKESFR